MAPNLEANWEEYIQHVKFWRNEVKRSFGEGITRLELLSDMDGHGGLTILGLATAPGDSASSQMIMHAKIPMDLPLPADDDAERPILELKPLVDAPQLLASGAQGLNTSGDGQQQQQQGKPPPELALHYERLRGQIVSGVTAYSVHAQSGAVLISSATSQLVVYKDKQLTPIAQWLCGSSLLNAAFCPSDPSFVAFNSGNQLYIDRLNTEVFSSSDTSPRLYVTNGVASFVTQEEFERYEGFWWSPKRVELLYERVDESRVAQLSFLLPGARADDEEPMRYPLTGTPNATSELRLCTFDEKNSGQFEDLQLDADLQAKVPWMEYIVRAGWAGDGEEVFILAMDRLQTQMAILLIPRTLFVSKPGQGTGIWQIRVVYEETCSRAWINANNLLNFLPPPPVDRMQLELAQQQQQFVLGSESTDKCHLSLHKCGIVTAKVRPITASEEWTVLKEAILKVDPVRSLCFFLANRLSPLILSLCVASFRSNNDGTSTEAAAAPPDCRVLTPSNLSYRFERSDPSIYLNPDVGFVCWLSAVDRLPECRFYRLLHSPEDPLPRAIFTHRLGVQVTSPTAGFGTDTATWGFPNLHREPSSIFSHRFVQYESRNSGQLHHALLLLPANAVPGTKHPVIHGVYAGPSIQLVKNDWQTISQYIKFITFGYAVVLVDGRGSANRGVRFESAIKERLGSVEIEDQLEGLQNVAEQSGGILDLDRVAVIGWSYGGYVSLQLLAEYPHIYKAACVGGAVTDWQLYDTAYTERYMGMPQQNAEAYKQSGALSKINKLPSQEGRLLIVHGMIDENVHFQHTVKLINALLAAQKPHQLLLFPGERHAVRNGESIEHMHATILSFFGRALGSGHGGNMSTTAKAVAGNDQ